MQIVIPVREVRPATPRARIVTLNLAGQPFPFLPGQSVELGTSEQSVRKPYSIACAPGQAASRDALEFLVQFDDEAGASPHLTRLAPKRQVVVEGPVGSFVLPQPIPARPLLFIAGGTGIAPIRSMLWSAILGGHRQPITLLYSARREEELACWDEFRALEAEGRLTLRGAVTRDDGRRWTGWRGRIDRARLECLGVDPAALCFLCGPSSLIDDLSSALGALGVPADRIRFESWRAA